MGYFLCQVSPDDGNHRRVVALVRPVRVAALVAALDADVTAESSAIAEDSLMLYVLLRCGGLDIYSFHILFGLVG